MIGTKMNLAEEMMTELDEGMSPEEKKMSLRKVGQSKFVSGANDLSTGLKHLAANGGEMESKFAEKALKDFDKIWKEGVKLLGFKPFDPRNPK